jgi:hypothetical protein
MKYFIAGKEKHSDKKLQTGSLEDYYELGWEVVTTHLYAKHLINNKALDPDQDIIVTCEGREFLYDKFIKTICWKEFEDHTKKQIIAIIDPINFFLNTIFQETSDFYDLYFVNNNPIYKYFDTDFDIITDFSKNSDIIPKTPYICMNRRFRKHREHLNMSENYTNDLIKNIQDKYNVPIFLTGFHNESFVQPGVNIVNLQDWCSLINHENCLFCIQNQTGTANLTQICARQELLNIIIDMEGAHFMPVYANGRRPDVLGKSVNFKKIKNIIFYKTPLIQEINSTLDLYVKS